MILMKINKENFKWPTIYTFVIGFLAHGYAFLNFQPSHDQLNESINNLGLAIWKIQIGRYLESIYNIFLGKFYSFPWINGILGLIWISLSVYLVTSIFKMEKKLCIAMISGLMVTPVTVSATIATYTDFSAYMLSLLFSIFAVYLWNYLNENVITKKNKILLILLSSFSITCSLAIYQAYICVYISLIIIVSIIKLIKSDKNILKDILIKDINAIFIILLGCAIYYLGCQVISFITGLSLYSGTENSISNVWQSGEAISIRIKEAYTQVFNEIIFSTSYVNFFDFNSRIINISLLIIGLLAMFLIIRKNKTNISNIILSILYILILPLGLNFIRLLNPLVHTLMIYAFNLIFIFIFILVLDQNKIIKYSTIILLSIMIFFNVQAANAMYVKKSMEQNATLSLMTRVLDSIEKIDEYIPNKTPVLFIGDAEDYLKTTDEFRKIKTIRGLEYSSASTVYRGSNSTYFKLMLGREINLKYNDQAFISSLDKDGLDEMPLFPSSNSIQMIDGVVVVKFKELD